MRRSKNEGKKLNVTQLISRNIATAGKDDLQTAMYKATTDDGLPPKEKHVLTLIKMAGEPETEAQVATQVLRRLRDCRHSKAAGVAAKTLVVLHRIVLAGPGAGFGAVLRDEVVPELALVCGTEPEEVSAPSECCRQCARYLGHLCAWRGARTLRSADPSAPWRAAASDAVFELLGVLQPLIVTSLECAPRNPLSNAALSALRLGVLEDVLTLSRIEAAAAARLNALLLTLPTEEVSVAGASAAAVNDARGALDVIEVSIGHARLALDLQQELMEQVDAEPDPALQEVLARARPWRSESGISASESRMAPESPPQPPWAARQSTDAQAMADRDALILQLLEMLPADTTSSLAERTLGRPCAICGRTEVEPRSNRGWKGIEPTSNRR